MSEETTECPLCMEVLELDDLTFFPCNCGYQVCRFCWHRIRTDEDGLCPACRQPYSENPAQFKPITSDEITQLKKEKKQKESQERQKIIENRKHLSELRVIQKNLVFVVGLPTTLTDPDLLKRQDHFGKYGKIIKATFSKNTNPQQVLLYQSAYITFAKVEDALRAIKSINQLQVNGKQFKASLGTTKYCSRFLKGIQCLKPDCMYVHEMIEEDGTFTKEEIQAGKHFHYEQKLYNQLFGDAISPSIITTVTFTSTNNSITTTTTIITTTHLLDTMMSLTEDFNKDSSSFLTSTGRLGESKALNGPSTDFDCLQRSLTNAQESASNKTLPNNSLLSGHLEAKNKNKKKKPQSTDNKNDLGLKSSASDTFPCPSKRYVANHVDAFQCYSNSESEDEKLKSDVNNNDLNDWDSGQRNDKGVLFGSTNGIRKNDSLDARNKETESSKTRINYTDILKKTKTKSKPATNKMTLLTKPSSKVPNNLKNKCKKEDRVADRELEGVMVDDWSIKDNTTVLSLSETTRMYSDSQNANSQIAITDVLTTSIQVVVTTSVVSLPSPSSDHNALLKLPIDDKKEEDKRPDDDLDFDPWHEISAGLDQMLEFENYLHQHLNLYKQPQPLPHQASKSSIRPTFLQQQQRQQEEDKKCLQDKIVSPQNQFLYDHQQQQHYQTAQQQQQQQHYQTAQQQQHEQHYQTAQQQQQQQLQSYYSGYKTQSSFNLSNSPTSSFPTFMPAASLKNNPYISNNQLNSNSPLNSNNLLNTNTLNSNNPLNSNSMFPVNHTPNNKNLFVNAQNYQPKNLETQATSSYPPNQFNNYSDSRFTSQTYQARQNYEHYPYQLQGRQYPDATAQQSYAPSSKLSLFSDRPQIDHSQKQQPQFSQKKWLEGLKAMFPNVNISFGPNPPFVKNQSGHSQSVEALNPFRMPEHDGCSSVDNTRDAQTLFPTKPDSSDVFKLANDHYNYMSFEPSIARNARRTEHNVCLTPPPVPIFQSQQPISHASSLSTLTSEKTSFFLPTFKASSSQKQNITNSFNEKSNINSPNTARPNINKYNSRSVADTVMAISSLNSFNNYIASDNTMTTKFSPNDCNNYSAISSSLFTNPSMNTLYNSNPYSNLNMYDLCPDPNLASKNGLNYAFPIQPSNHATQPTKPPPGFEKASKK